MAKQPTTVNSLLNGAALNPNPTSSYASKVNAKFKKNKSHYVTLLQRYNDSVKANPHMQRVIQYALNNWTRNYPLVKTWDHFVLCQAQQMRLSDILIDVTLQREFDVAHAANIINKFQQVNVQAINVYFDPAMPGKGICWNGQHTVLVLFMLALHLGIDPDTISVPVVITASTLKAEMRNCFISLSTDAVKKLDDIDIIHQKIYGVRTDGSTNPDWVEIELKQQYLEQNEIFLTHDKFGDTHHPGAMTRVDKFLDTKRHVLDDTKNFAEYFFALCNSNRPVKGTDVWITYDFFRNCRKDKIAVDSNYVSELAYCLNHAHEGTFDPDKFYERVVFSWREDYKIHKKSPDGTLLGIQYPHPQMAETFLNAQLKHSGFTQPLPNINPLWHVPKEHLF